MTQPGRARMYIHGQISRLWRLSLFSEVVMEVGRDRFDAARSVLLLTDIQPDFMPGGALPVEEGDLIVEPVRRLATSGLFRLILATQDWHPPEHVSFARNHPGKRPFDVIDLYGYPQVLWPDHCVQGTTGASIHGGMPMDKVAAIVRKGMDPECDSYSAFRNNWNARGERPRTGLAGYLREREVEEVFLCGLARDFCVKWSAEDATDAGFRVWILWDLTRPVDRSSDDQVRRSFQERGIGIMDSASLKGGQAP
jgi:nicotinamidase/pyrazinamidase